MSTHTIRSTRHTRPTRSEDVYVTAVHRETVRLIVRSQGAQAPQDVAQDVVISLLGKVQTVMASYPDPVVYARAAYRHACVQAGRRDRVQRGEGSRLYERADGSRAPGHQVISGDDTGPSGERSTFDTLVDGGAAFDDAVCGRLDDRRRLTEALSRVAPGDRAAYFMVRGLGYPVTEVANTIGVRRETLQRRLGRIDAHIQPLRSSAL